MIITISGSPGSGKSTVARMIAKRLNIQHFSIGDFMRDIAKEKGISMLEIGKLAETERWIDAKLDDRMMKLGINEDNFIVDARIGFHFIPRSIKIFLTVDLEEGAKRIIKSESVRKEEKENTSLEETKKNIIQRQKSEKERYLNYYEVNHLDMKHYDIVIDTTHISPEEVVQKILAFIGKS